MTCGDPALRSALAASQRLGMLGDRPIDDVIEHSRAFVAALAGVQGTVADLGAGGGVPGLVVASARPDLRVVLIERRAARVDHLRRLIRRLGLAERVSALLADATRAELGEPVDAVTARGFGPPATTLRAATRLVRSGGVVVVSEPPVPSAERWPSDLLYRLGLSRIANDDRRVAVFRRCDVPRET